MTTVPEFKEFPKIARLNRECIITEKIDGTNACVVVAEDGGVWAQSRNRLLSHETDPFGFALWVERNKDALREVLGTGYHFGEWWGSGIQRRYGLEGPDKRLSLFNVERWVGPRSRRACSRSRCSIAARSAPMRWKLRSQSCAPKARLPRPASRAPRAWSSTTSRRRWDSRSRWRKTRNVKGSVPPPPARRTRSATIR